MGVGKSVKMEDSEDDYHSKNYQWLPADFEVNLDRKVEIIYMAAWQ